MKISQHGVDVLSETMLPGVLSITKPVSGAFTSTRVGAEVFSSNCSFRKNSDRSALLPTCSTTNVKGLFERGFKYNL